MSLGDFGMYAANRFCCSVGASASSGSWTNRSLFVSPPSANNRRRPGATRPSTNDAAVPVRRAIEAKRTISRSVISDIGASVLDLDHLADDQRAGDLQHDGRNDHVDAEWRPGQRLPVVRVDN